MNRIPIKNFTEESEAETKPIPVPITSVRSAPEEPSSDEIFSIVKSEITSDSDIKSVSLAIKQGEKIPHLTHFTKVSTLFQWTQIATGTTEDQQAMTNQAQAYLASLAETDF